MIYTVIINSNNRISGSVANANYVFDWSALQQSKYKMTFDLICTDVNTTVAEFGCVHINLGQNNVFQVTTQTERRNTNMIGTFFPNENSTSTFLYSDKNTNSPLYLSCRPVSNDFCVKLTTSDLAATDFFDSNGFLIDDYILTLCFETI